MKADYIGSAVNELDKASDPDKAAVGWRIANSYLSPKSDDLPLLDGCMSDGESAKAYAKF